MTSEQKKFDDIKNATDYQVIGDDVDYEEYDYSKYEEESK